MLRDESMENRSTGEIGGYRGNFGEILDNNYMVSIGKIHITSITFVA